MSLTLIYMSGTGNSLRVAKWFADAAVQRGQPARIVQYNQARQSLLPADLWGGTIGFVFPAHGFTAPWAMIWTALCMPHARGTSAFVAVTRAGTKFGPLFLPGMEGTAGYLLALILRLKSYCVRGMIGLDMPCNWTSVHPGFSEASARAIIGRTKPKVLAFINRILAGHSSFGLAGFICLLLGLVLLPVSLGYMLSFRFVLAKAFFASNRCTGCGLCAASCPAHAIRMLGRRRPRPYWTYYCESCMRCMSFRPERAVDAGHSWGALQLALTSIPVGTLVLNRAAAVWPSLASSAERWQVLIQYLYSLLAMFLAYLLFSLLIRLRPINALFTVTTLTRIYRRCREPDTRVNDLMPGEDQEVKA